MDVDTNGDFIEDVVDVIDDGLDWTSSDVEFGISLDSNELNGFI